MQMAADVGLSTLLIKIPAEVAHCGRSKTRDGHVPRTN
jgi:hypothetical protein